MSSIGMIFLGIRWMGECVLMWGESARDYGGILDLRYMYIVNLYQMFDV